MNTRWATIFVLVGFAIGFGLASEYSASRGIGWVVGAVAGLVAVGLLGLALGKETKAERPPRRNFGATIHAEKMEQIRRQKERKAAT